MDDIDEPLPGDDGTEDGKIVSEAKRDFKRCQDRESDCRDYYVEDVKFAYGDSRNGYQWPDAVRRKAAANSVMLTVNKTKQHCLQIINDGRQNKAMVQVRPIGGGATYEAAKVFEGIVRHIEYVSNAQAAYDCASWCQVVGGIGYWRILTDYVNDDSFDQEIYIRRIPDPLTVYLDPDIQQFDGSDARFGFVFEDLTREEFRRKYPEAEFPGHDAPLGEGNGDGWDDKDKVRVAEYYRMGEEADTLHFFSDGSTQREGRMPKEKLDLARSLSVKSRKIASPKVEWFKIAGSKIIARGPWAGRYIPIVRVIGEEIVVDGKLDRIGHVRSLIDPQRMYNYWTSSATEQVALQTKTPYIAAVEAVEGYVDHWAKANVENLAFLPWNAFDEKGQAIPKPEREQPPQMAEAYMNGLKIAAEEMRMVSGQYQADMGAPSNERSGKAIQERQRQGDNATYHFIDHLGQAIRFTGRILIDLIPKIYDTARVIKILGEDGTQTAVHLQPGAGQAHKQVQDPTADDYDPQQVTAIFDPNVGEYDVESDIGPAYATRRQEMVNAGMQILSSNEQLTPVIGDIVIRGMDFPGADEMADRLRNMVPAQALGGPDPQMQEMQKNLQAAQMHIQGLQQELTMAKSHAVSTQEKRDIEQYKADTARIEAIADADPAIVQTLARAMLAQVIKDSPGAGLDVLPLLAAHQQATNDMQPQPEPAQAAQ